MKKYRDLQCCKSQSQDEIKVEDRTACIYNNLVNMQPHHQQHHDCHKMELQQQKHLQFETQLQRHANQELNLQQNKRSINQRQELDQSTPKSYHSQGLMLFLEEQRSFQYKNPGSNCNQSSRHNYEKNGPSNLLLNSCRPFGATDFHLVPEQYNFEEFSSSDSEVEAEKLIKEIRTKRATCTRHHALRQSLVQNTVPYTFKTSEVSDTGVFTYSDTCHCHPIEHVHLQMKQPSVKNSQRIHYQQRNRFSASEFQKIPEHDPCSCDHEDGIFLKTASKFCKPPIEADLHVKTSLEMYKPHIETSSYINYPRVPVMDAIKPYRRRETNQETVYKNPTFVMPHTERDKNGCSDKCSHSAGTFKNSNVFDDRRDIEVPGLRNTVLSILDVSSDCRNKYCTHKDMLCTCLDHFCVNTVDELYSGYRSDISLSDTTSVAMDKYTSNCLNNHRKCLVARCATNGLKHVTFNSSWATQGTIQHLRDLKQCLND